MRIRKSYILLFVFILMASPFAMVAQEERAEIYDYREIDEYIIGGITISGVKYLDSNALISISGLRTGQAITIPGEEISAAAKKLWNQGLFSDVRISIMEMRNDTVFLDIFLQERPRLSSLKITGLSRNETQDIREKIKLPAGSQITAFILNNTEKIIKDHFIEKGFHNTTVNFIQKDDPDKPNSVILTIEVNKNEKVKIGEIQFVGNQAFDDRKLKRQMKGTKEKNWNFFRASKYIEDKFAEDKEKLYTFYNDHGYKDFTILSDSVYRISSDRLGLLIKVDEGRQYFIRNITWVGNSIYPTRLLDQVLNIEKGSVYNKSLLNKRLKIDEDAVSSLYLDNGYLFSNLTPVEVKVEGDSVDIEVRIFEGDQ
ncbi:MAG TPA: POTRA domain-containing protein, partial [Bacteroidales bacterium]|nr:POTRA domain-containing protein [Bacteroidales bacterium]